MTTKATTKNPPIPDKVAIGHLRYKVEIDEDVMNRESAKIQNELSGFSNSSRQIIALHPGNPPDYQAETLLHEVLHQCLRVAGCDPNQDAKEHVEDVEERAVRAMSGPLLDVFRRNPELVAYLLHVVEE